MPENYVFCHYSISCIDNYANSVQPKRIIVCSPNILKISLVSVMWLSRDNHSKHRIKQTTISNNIWMLADC